MSTHGNKVSRFTPGPWSLSERHGLASFSVAAGKKRIAAVWTTFLGFRTTIQSREEALANARLIAAAPDMLALLQELWRNPRVVSHSQGPSEDWLLRARAVMREATGDF